MGTTRRRFIKELGVASVALPLSAAIFNSLLAKDGRQAAAKARVVVVRDDKVLEGGKPVASRVTAMLKLGLETLLGRDPAQALKTLLGGSRRVGLKVNCLSGRPLSTRPEVAFGLADLITGSVPGTQVTVWDRSERELTGAGFAIKPEGAVTCLATDSDGVGYEELIREAGAVGSRFSRLLTELCDSVVSLAVLKDHGIAGISGCMKNFYGAIHNPNKYHPNGCDPYVADLFQSDLLKARLKLSIADGLIAVYSGGPGYKLKYRWEFKGLILGLDAVAVDRVCLDLIDARRREAGIRSLAADGREPAYILTAGRRGLGVSDLAEIDVVNVAPAS